MPETTEIEERFRAFKNTQTEKNLNDISCLKSQAQKIRDEDVELSDRIMQRVRLLENRAKKIAGNSVANIKPSSSDADRAKVREAETPKKQENNEKEVMPKPLSTPQKAIHFFKKPFVFFVILPTLLFALYQVFWASERYESTAKVIIQQSEGVSTVDASLSLLSGLTGSSIGNNDPELLESYIQSNDMLAHLDQTLDLKHYYSTSGADIFSRLPHDATQEDFLTYYQGHIYVEVDDNSGVITIAAQGFDPDFSHLLTKEIVARSEWYINNIGHQLADAQLSFIKVEHQLNEDKFKDAQVALLGFQQRYHLLDPTAEGAAAQQIAYGIEGQIAAKEAELKGLVNIMSENAPQVQATQNDLEALRRQLINERSKLSADGGNAIPVSEILAKYTDLKIAMELALQSYTSSKISLEQTRIEAYRQLKYLITVQTATAPQESTYPDVLYNISLFVVFAGILFAVIRIIYAIIHELK